MDKNVLTVALQNSSDFQQVLEDHGIFAEAYADIVATLLQDTTVAVQPLSPGKSGTSVTLFIPRPDLSVRYQIGDDSKIQKEVDNFWKHIDRKARSRYSPPRVEYSTDDKASSKTSALRYEWAGNVSEVLSVDQALRNPGVRTKDLHRNLNKLANDL